MKTIKLIAAVAFMFMAVGNARAQENSFSLVEDVNYDSIKVQTSLTVSDLKDFQAKVIQKVRTFNFNLVKLWAEDDLRKYTQEEITAERNKIKESTYNLFLEQAKPYFSNDTIGYLVKKAEDGRYVYDNLNGTPVYCDNNTEMRRDEKGKLRAYVYDRIRHDPPYMETTNVKNNQTKHEEMRKYINRIRPQKGMVVKANYGGYHFVDKLQKISEGHYVGSVAYYQEFSKYTTEGKKRYADVTYKTMSVHIILETVTIGNEKIQTWNVYLGDVKATQTSSI